MDLQIDRIRRADPPAGRSQSHRCAPRRAALMIFPGNLALPPDGRGLVRPAGKDFPTIRIGACKTVTIVLEGGLEHRDHTGRARRCWARATSSGMTAGRGVVHSEMPSAGGVHSLQLWLNLPASQKMSVATYRDQARCRHAGENRGRATRCASMRGRHDDLEHPHGSLWPLTAARCGRCKARSASSSWRPPGTRAFLYIVSGQWPHRRRRYGR